VEWTLRVFLFTDETNVSDESEDEYDNKEDLFLRFQRIMGPQICSSEHAQQV